MDAVQSLSLAWALAATLLAVPASIACALAIRARHAVAAQALALAADVETLNDRLWALADSEERYRSLIEAQGDLIVRRDGTRIIYANGAYGALLGLDEAQVVGSHANPVSLDIRIGQALPDGSRVFDERLATPAGERWISWVETVVPVASGKTVLQRVGRDITARIAGEEALVEARSKAEGANQAKSRFLATVSHEFRTPLNGILGMADLLGDTALDAEQKTYVAALRTSGEALLGLVDDILDFAKVEAGKLELASAPFDLSLLVETVAELMAPRAQAKGIELAAFLSPDLPSHLVGDKDRLRQILLNLAGNAVKFTRSGGVGLRLSRVGETLAIEVCDTGPGIPQDRLETIFDEFEQVQPGAGGTGLGLAIVRRLVALMGGEVAVDSVAGEGARFRVLLPLTVAPDAEPALPLPDWRGKRVLLVSDAPFGAAYLAQAVTQAGGSVDQVRDPAEGLARIATQGGYDAALIDHAVIAGDPRALTAALAKAGLRDVLVVLSPYERRSLGSPAAAGFSGFLVKPVRARSLYQRLWRRGASLGPHLTSPALPVARPQAHGLDVLVAEDNEINALLVTRTLERLGCRPVWARDGREAVALARAGLAGETPAFDLALLDIRMPELDGLAAARLIRQGEAERGLQPMPILALTANVADSDREAALAAGMNDCLAKPLSRDALEGWIVRVSQGRGEAREAMRLTA